MTPPYNIAVMNEASRDSTSKEDSWGKRLRPRRQQRPLEILPVSVQRRRKFSRSESVTKEFDQLECNSDDDVKTEEENFQRSARYAGALSGAIKIEGDTKLQNKEDLIKEEDHYTSVPFSDAQYNDDDEPWISTATTTPTSSASSSSPYPPAPFPASSSTSTCSLEEDLADDLDQDHEVIVLHNSPADGLTSSSRYRISLRPWIFIAVVLRFVLHLTTEYTTSEYRKPFHPQSFILNLSHTFSYVPPMTTHIDSLENMDRAFLLAGFTIDDVLTYSTFNGTRLELPQKVSQELGILKTQVVSLKKPIEDSNRQLSSLVSALGTHTFRLAPPGSSPTDPLELHHFTSQALDQTLVPALWGLLDTAERIIAVKHTLMGVCTLASTYDVANFSAALLDTELSVILQDGVWSWPEQETLELQNEDPNAGNPNCRALVTSKTASIHRFPLREIVFSTLSNVAGVLHSLLHIAQGLREMHYNSWLSLSAKEQRDIVLDVVGMNASRPSDDGALYTAYNFTSFSVVLDMLHNELGPAITQVLTAEMETSRNATMRVLGGRLGFSSPGYYGKGMSLNEAVEELMAFLRGLYAERRERRRRIEEYRLEMWRRRMEGLGVWY